MNNSSLLKCSSTLENELLLVARHNAVEDLGFVAIFDPQCHAALVRDDDAATAEPFPGVLGVHQKSCKPIVCMVHNVC